MAVFNPGNGGTLKSITLEDVTLELLYIIREIEKLLPTEEQKLTLSIDEATGIVTFSGTIAADVAVNATGKPVLIANGYLQTSFTRGAQGTLYSTSLGESLVETLYTFRRAEEFISAELRKLSLAFDHAANVIQYSGSLATTITLGGEGKPVIDAVEYLPTVPPLFQQPGS